jgi:hypothetical protein
LWTAGLVELVTYHPDRPALTDHATYWRAMYERVRAAPVATYQAYRERLAARGQPPSEDPHGSVAAYLEAYRAVAERPPVCAACS